MVVARPPHPESRLLAAAFTALMVAALMQSTLLVMIDPGLLGWRPDHGHVFLGGAALDGGTRPHRHPGDATGPGAPAQASSAVVFTSADDGVAGVAASALAVPAALVVVAAVAPVWAVAASAAVTPLHVVLAAPTPPPRG